MFEHDPAWLGAAQLQEFRERITAARVGVAAARGKWLAARAGA